MAPVAKETISSGFVRLGNGCSGCKSGSIGQGSVFI